MPRKTRTRLFLAPVVARNDDTAMAGRFLVVKPVKHLFCAVLLDIIGIAGAFRPRWIMFPTFAHPPVVQLMDLREQAGSKYYGEEVFQLPKAQLIEQICLDVETHCLPFFRSMLPFENLYRYAMDEDQPGVWQRANLHFRFELAMGNFEAADMLMRWNRRRWFADRSASADSESFAREQELCLMLESRDHKGIADFLREIEAKVAANYGIAHLWEPTPFPFEI